MSKLYNNYLELKKEENSYIYLFKSGIFYIALQEDAKVLSQKFGLKLTNLNDTIIKCGFPSNCIDKYISLFTNNNIKFKIIDSKINTSFSPTEYKQDTKTKELLNLINNTNPDLLSIKEAYSFIENIKDMAKEILVGDDVINE